jgi:nicotinamidase-related amidase
VREALVVVDMLADFLDPTGTLYCGDAARGIIPAVHEAVEKARARGIPVLYVADTHDPDDPEFQVFPPHCVAGTWGSGVIPEILPQEGEPVIAKRRFSGFYGTDLDLRLRERGIDSLVLVGVCTNICVLYTAADARMRNYGVTVPRDSVASFDPEAGGFALGQMEKVLGVQVVSSW